MIKAEVNKGKVYINECNGTGLELMSELCCLVRGVCTGYCSDEEHSEEMTKQMVSTVAWALLSAEELMKGVDLEDDENADF